MKRFKQLFLSILKEAKYDNDYWKRVDVYKGIQIYIRTDNHLMKRIKQRYDHLVLNNVIRVVKKLIKQQNKKENNIFEKYNNQVNHQFSYTVYGIISNIYVCGRFKSNNDIWRCYISTVLPNFDTNYSRNDQYFEVNI